MVDVSASATCCAMLLPPMTGCFPRVTSFSFPPRRHNGVNTVRSLNTLLQLYSAKLYRSFRPLLFARFVFLWLLPIWQTLVIYLSVPVFFFCHLRLRTLPFVVAFISTTMSVWPSLLGRKQNKQIVSRMCEWRVYFVICHALCPPSGPRRLDGSSDVCPIEWELETWLFFGLCLCCTIEHFCFLLSECMSLACLPNKHTWTNECTPIFVYTTLFVWWVTHRANKTVPAWSNRILIVVFTPNYPGMFHKRATHQWFHVSVPQCPHPWWQVYVPPHKTRHTYLLPFAPGILAFLARHHGHTGQRHDNSSRLSIAWYHHHPLVTWCVSLTCAVETDTDAAYAWAGATDVRLGCTGHFCFVPCGWHIVWLCG